MNDFSGNLIYRNGLINNNSNGVDDSNSNMWYSADTTQSNYWPDDAGQDADEDGIRDTSYLIPGGGMTEDLFPSVNPYRQ